MGKDIVDGFFEKKICGQNSLLDSVYEILSSRGFLLDKKKNNVIVSDNSEKDDLVFLDEILVKNDVGLIKDGKIFLSSHPQLANLKQIFYFYLNSETCFQPYWEKWNYFSRREHGFKIPVRGLDPFIARLVKAISAVGIISTLSCDGHNGRTFPRVYLAGKYNAMWFKVLLDCFVKNKKSLAQRWEFKNNNCEISISQKNILDTYVEIIEVGNIFYSNRVYLREMKKYLKGNIRKEKIQGSESKEVYSIFKENFFDIKNELKEKSFQDDNLFGNG